MIYESIILHFVNVKSFKCMHHNVRQLLIVFTVMFKKEYSYTFKLVKQYGVHVQYLNK